MKGAHSVPPAQPDPLVRMLVSSGVERGQVHVVIVVLPGLDFRMDPHQIDERGGLGDLDPTDPLEGHPDIGAPREDLEHGTEEVVVIPDAPETGSVQPARKDASLVPEGFDEGDGGIAVLGHQRLEGPGPRLEMSGRVRRKHGTALAGEGLAAALLGSQQVAVEVAPHGQGVVPVLERVELLGRPFELAREDEQREEHGPGLHVERVRLDSSRALLEGFHELSRSD